ncbi:putative sulfate exporter family transporter [Halomonas denitrificans]|nr:YeiH family protein [Halomonas denitrificans]
MNPTALRVLFLVAAAAMLLPWLTAPIGLAAGAVFGLLLGNPYAERTGKLAGQLLKVCVVGLGFGLSLPAVLETGATGLWLMGLWVILVLGTGLLLARAFGVESATGRLVSAGTAICGGTAIAAVAPVLRAKSESISTAMACVFVLNAVALYLYPWTGRQLGLSESQFALWAAVAIHDTSSVVGAASAYGPQALAEATVLKLARALWILPLVLGFALLVARDDGTSRLAGFKPPVFIGVFVLAAAARSLLPSGEPLFDALYLAARQGLVLVLFLVGAGLSRDLLARVGWRPFAHGLTLWLLATAASLAAVLAWVT